MRVNAVHMTFIEAAVTDHSTSPERHVRWLWSEIVGSAVVAAGRHVGLRPIRRAIAIARTSDG